ncbi:MAG TPA: EAL domain-containing protein [Terriglobales bacterium]|nr:EAL domain-containing protein [Terriglobales bacterium]
MRYEIHPGDHPPGVSRTRRRSLPESSRRRAKSWWASYRRAVLSTLLLVECLLHASCGFHSRATLPAIGYTPWLIVGLCSVLAVPAAYRRLRIERVRLTAKREELFRLVAENAADMIALVDTKGRRLYNNPAYRKILGYSPEELEQTSAFEQIHPDDRFKVMEAAREAREGAAERRLEYRMRHKNGTWCVLESTASAIRNPKGEVEELVIVNRDITERRRAEEQLEHDAFHDPLTGFPKRNLFVDRLQHCWLRARRSPAYKYAVLFVDVDGFRVFNDSMGHVVGDQLIIEIGRRLSSCLRYDDTVTRPKGQWRMGDPVLSRLGGDEFTILLDGLRDPSDAMRVAERIQTAMGRPFEVGGRQVFTSASVGIALSTTPHERPEDLLRDADIAMRRAKSLGKSRCQLFDIEMHTRAVSRLKLESELRQALEQEQLRLHYQPIVRVESGQIVGFEALLRWQHPEQGLLVPDNFIEMAENTGLIVPMGRWVLESACRQIRAWQSRFPSHPPLSVSVNVSAKQFAHTSLVGDAEAAIHKAEIEPSSLQLEITESMAMADPDFTDRVLVQLKHLGVQIGIDDFGTGHSSLSRLRRFPVDVIKIDRSFVHNMNVDQVNRDIVNLIITLAQNLNLKAVAEGVESPTHVTHLKQLHCKLAQGFLFSPPVEAEKAERLLATGVSPGEGGNQARASVAAGTDP